MKNNISKNGWIPESLKTKSSKLSFRKLFFNRKYKANYTKLLPYVKRNDAKTVPSSAFDVTHLPLDINHYVTKESPNFELKVFKNYYTVEPMKKTDNFVSSNNSFGDVMAHATWLRKVSEDKNSSFLNAAKSIIKKSCGEQKEFVNADLVNECNYFLLSKKFKYAGCKFTYGDDEFTFFYYQTYAQEPLIIPNGLQMSFIVDDENSVNIKFDNKPVKYFLQNKNIPDNKDMYVVLTCKLVVAYNEMDGNNEDLRCDEGEETTKYPIAI